MLVRAARLRTDNAFSVQLLADVHQGLFQAQNLLVQEFCGCQRDNTRLRLSFPRERSFIPEQRPYTQLIGEGDAV